MNFKNLYLFFATPALIVPTISQANFFKNLPPLSYRDLTIAVSSMVSTAGIVTFITSKYHPAALEKQRLILAAHEKKKQEHAAHVLEQQKIALENQKKHALQEFEQLQRTYTGEVQLLQDPNTVNKTTLLDVIKKKFNVQQTPINHYYQTLTNDLAKLQKLEAHFPHEKMQERIILIRALEQIKDNHHLLLAEMQKVELAGAVYKKRLEEVEERKIEREKLELEKLRAKIENERNKKTVLSQIQVQQELIKSKLDNLLKAQPVEQSLLLHEINELRKKQIETLDEIKTLKKAPTKHNNDLTFSYTRMPAYNPELKQPAPSAPPL